MSGIDILRDKKIIIADDEDFIRSHLSKKLCDMGLIVFEAASGREVLDLMNRQPDLILMDVRMPEVDGYETTRRIRKGTLVSRVPIILLSALAGDEDIHRGIQSGADEFLCKPVTFSVIIEVISNKLNTLQIS